MKYPNIRDNWQQKKILQSKAYQYKAFEAVNEIVICERQRKKIILVDGTQLTEFISCSYLGLDQDERLIQAANNNLHKCGVTFSSARTRALVKSFLDLEALLNKIFYNAYSVTFASVHLANQGVFPLLASGEMPSFPFRNHGPLFIMDKTAHASTQINRGLLQQFGEIVLVNFKNLSEIEKHFQIAEKSFRTPITLSDSVGSMGGTNLIVELLNFAEKYDGYVYLDDAHGTSICGKHGCGFVLDKLGGFHSRLILTASMAKAFGAVGGVIVMPTLEDAKMVKRFASTYVFGGPPPLAIIDSAIASAQIHLTEEIYLLQNKLQKNITDFDSFSGELPNTSIINYGRNFPIRGILIGDEYKTIECTSKLRKKGFAVTAAMYPTIWKGKGMLRINVAVNHTRDEIKGVCKAIQEII